MGKIEFNQISSGSLLSILSLSLLTSNANLSILWWLDALCINNEDDKMEEDLTEETKTFFRKG